MRMIRKNITLDPDVLKRFCEIADKKGIQVSTWVNVKMKEFIVESERVVVVKNNDCDIINHSISGNISYIDSAELKESLEWLTNNVQVLPESERWSTPFIKYGVQYITHEVNGKTWRRDIDPSGGSNHGEWESN